MHWTWCFSLSCLAPLAIGALPFMGTAAITLCLWVRTMHKSFLGCYSPYPATKASRASTSSENILSHLKGVKAKCSIQQSTFFKTSDSTKVTCVPHPFKINRLCNIPSLICPERFTLDLKSSMHSLSWNLAAEMTEFLPSQCHVVTSIKAAKSLDLLLIPQHFFVVITTFLYHHLFRKVNQKHKIVSSEFLPAGNVLLIG